MITKHPGENGGTMPAWGIAAIVLFFSAILVIHAYHYLPFLSDDALISLRYARRLLQGDGLTWTDGPRVEGYSNLLWILLVACLGALHIDLVDAARMLGIAGMGVVIFAVVYGYARGGSWKRTWLSLAAGLMFFSLSSPVAIWAIGGLEQPLMGALLAMAILLGFSLFEPAEPENRNTYALLSLALGLMCLTRPDGPIFTVATVAAFLVARRISGRQTSIRDLFMLLLFPVAFYGGQVLFRLYYYGEFVPNTALVKLTPSLYHAVLGLQYVVQGLAAQSMLSLLAVVSLIAMLLVRETRAKAVLLISMLLLWIVYVAAIGGDIFPGWRHFIPVIVIFTFAVIEGMRIALAYAESRKVWWLMLAGTVILYLPYASTQFRDPENRRAMEERWEWDGKAVGLMLKQAFSEQQPLVAVTAAGCIPYWSELPALDMLGLNDYYLPRHPPSDLGQGFLGHEIGNGKYVLDRKPDIIVFLTGVLWDGYRSGREMQQTQEFHENYVAVRTRVRLSDSNATILWMRKYSNRTGVRQTPHEIVVPGYLLGTGQDTAAYLNDRKELVLPLSKGRSAMIDIGTHLSSSWHCTAYSSSGAAASCAIMPVRSGSRISVETRSAQPLEISRLVLRDS